MGFAAGKGGGHGQPWMMILDLVESSVHEGIARGRGLGEVEEGLRVLTTEGIKLWRPNPGDRRGRPSSVHEQRNEKLKSVMLQWIWCRRCN